TDFVFSTNQGQTQTTLANIITNPEGSFRDQGRNTAYWKFEDNASYTRGNHSFRFGGSLQTYKTVALHFAGNRRFYTIMITTVTNPNEPGLTAALFTGG